LPFSKGKTIVIKSTVTPGTTQGYAEKYPDVNWVFNPEFLTESNYLSDFVKTERIVIGLEAGALLDTRNLMKDLYMSIPYFTTTPMLFMTATEAEIVKYQSNILLATKIAVSNVIYDLCQKMVCADYERVKSGVSLDNRIGDSHLDITEERGFGGKCFAKDLGAFIGKCKDMGVDADLLEEVFNYNCRIRKVHDWNEIPGATKEGKQYDEV